ncbi:manganese efflux pump MntP family protein [Paenibacillus thalictri]|uniref:Putative manganese efflux pump MntP n=1 Tax=Paenibacillus thalictri TaxID=2527873 RepID=A0A4Q9DL67_9BACL|nr:manganese efflux pump MntP family protein [Paenibacillus thalictri]TBL73075.1 manganese efflux pump [Paenibacillus thalictri]
MAVALGMDALSLGIGIGMRGIRLLDIAKISLIIAVFHMIMPLMGMFTGQYVSHLLGSIATMLGGALLVLLGAHMVYSSLKGDEVRPFDHRTLWGMLVFALSVSVDSFSVGVSLGMFSSDLLLTVLLFGSFGGAMSIIGLLLGRRVGHWIGEYGEALGGIVLLSFGLKFLF